MVDPRWNKIQISDLTANVTRAAGLAGTPQALFGRAFELDDRKSGHGRAMVESSAPPIKFVPQRIQIDAAMAGGIRRQIPAGAFEQRSATRLVPPRIMMQGDCNLDQALQKFAFGLRLRPPDILQDFVGFKEMGGVEQRKSLEERVVRRGLVVRGSHLG